MAIAIATWMAIKNALRCGSEDFVNVVHGWNNTGEAVRLSRKK